MIQRAPLALAALAACSFPTPSEELTCNIDSDCESGRFCDRGYCVVTGTDGGSGDDTPAVDCTMFPARHFDACALPAPGPKLQLDQAGIYVYNTDTGTLTAPDASTQSPPSFDAASGKVISIDGLIVGSPATLRAIGTKPMIVASWSTIEVSGLVDVGSTALENGAGANNPGCVAAGAGQNSGEGAGGSGGGGFAGIGGAGGAGDVGNGGGAGGVIAMPLLAGGCPGAKGGGGNTANNGGAGGAGGGAIQLTARLSITIGGTITAAGAGGGGSPRDDGAGGGDGGGGGGGSGGMIGLESPSVTLKSSAILAANGGGGGAGAENLAGNPGANGLTSALRAPGGTAGDGGAGGLGSGGATMNGANGNPEAGGGGGGGGGGAGFIAVIKMAPTIDASAVVSPAITVAP